MCFRRHQQRQINASETNEKTHEMMNVMFMCVCARVYARQRGRVQSRTQSRRKMEWKMSSRWSGLYELLSIETTHKTIRKPGQRNGNKRNWKTSVARREACWLAGEWQPCDQSNNKHESLCVRVWSTLEPLQLTKWNCLQYNASPLFAYVSFWLRSVHWMHSRYQYPSMNYAFCDLGSFLLHISSCHSRKMQIINAMDGRHSLCACVLRSKFLGRNSLR